MEAALIFPHQLFIDNPCLRKGREVYLVEDHLYFTQFNFHQQKILLHRASMKYYEQLLKSKGYKVNYIEFSQHESLDAVFQQIQASGMTVVHYTETVDYLLERRIKRFSKNYQISLTLHRTPDFLLTVDEFRVMTDSKKYFMANFYIQQRKKFKILVDEEGEPIGKKWSFDTENRKKITKNISLPDVYTPAENQYVLEAKQYVTKHFSSNYGLADPFRYATTHAEAVLGLEDFLHNRMRLFGDYEDAIVSNQSILFHSVLTPALNIGLLTPQQIIDTTFEYAAIYFYPLNSLEGFVRQIIGWREFMRGVYVQEGVFERFRNHQNFSHKIPEQFWKGETGIEPIDTTIRKILDTGYCHHIERLMVMGNFMQLCEFDPNEVYRWFMTLFIDAYDWVMVPNVYGMSQYADGGLITTKPYVSGSNYILKMSDYKKGKWCDIWDALYWRYIYKNQDAFKQNQRMNMIVTLLSKMEKAKLQHHLKTAEKFLSDLHSSKSLEIDQSLQH
jgi:deoxyribodipyrimidine photolyase-related protein